MQLPKKVFLSLLLLEVFVNFSGIAVPFFSNDPALYAAISKAMIQKNDFTNPLEGELNNYSAIIRKIAKDNNCPVIDLRQIFTDYLKTNNPDNKDRGILTVDGVHLSITGNIFVAQKMFDVLSQSFIR